MPSIDPFDFDSETQQVDKSVAKTWQAPLVYIAGPLTGGHFWENVRAAVKAADYVREHGGVPIIPHLSGFWASMTDNACKADYETWMRDDFEIIARCDALLRIPGKSSGADREFELAEEIGVCVFTDKAALAAWIERWAPGLHTVRGQT